jgi:hypothetical protein
MELLFFLLLCGAAELEERVESLESELEDRDFDEYDDYDY